VPARAAAPSDRGGPELLDSLLSPEGRPYASAPPSSPGDPGRYHALFGRDSLIASLQLLPIRPDVAAATLRSLATLQGRRDDPETDEEPGKILHEHWPQAPTRLSEAGWPVRDGALLYYGSADSTSWFLVVLEALGDARLAAELEASWRAAGDWLERTLSRGGGLVRHGPRRGQGGLRQQGWRDTTDPLDPGTHGGGILREDGSPPQPPLADADSQAVAVAAAGALARLTGEQRHRELAKSLRERVVGAFAADTLAIEGDGRRVRGAGSQLGWLLWAGAAPVGAAERLVMPDVLTPWGLRTLSAEHPAFHPHAYHRGAVWPFDSWIGWAGLRAAGREDEAECLRTGVLTALDRLDGAPELYAAGADGPEPVAIANRVQAWTVGARWALEHGWDGMLSR
jgi:glycogen debranching enzyme